MYYDNAMSTKIGRPPKPPDQLRDGILHIRFTQDELKMLADVAERAGMNLSTLARDTLIQWAYRYYTSRNIKPKRKTG
jgi:hypothetical protein